MVRGGKQERGRHFERPPPPAAGRRARFSPRLEGPTRPQTSLLAARRSLSQALSLSLSLSLSLNNTRVIAI